MKRVAIQQIMKNLKQHKYNPFKIRLVQRLNEDDFHRRLRFCKLVSEMVNNKQKYMLSVFRMSVHLITALQEISQNLIKNNLPLPVKYSNIAKYLKMIAHEAFQTHLEQLYTAYHLFPIPMFYTRTSLHIYIPIKVHANDQHLAKSCSQNLMLAQYTQMHHMKRNS